MPEFSPHEEIAVNRRIYWALRNVYEKHVICPTPDGARFESGVEEVIKGRMEAINSFDVGEGSISPRIVALNSLAYIDTIGGIHETA